MANRVAAPDTLRAGELDVLYTGIDHWAVLGPVAGIDDAALAARLDEIAALGTHTRVGLRPSRRGARWSWDPHPGSTAVLPECPVPCTGLEQVLHHAMSVHPDVPLAVWRCGAHLCVYYDHGLGDANFSLRLFAALTNPTAVAGFAVGESRMVTNPFGTAFLAALRTAPRALGSDVLRIAKLAAARLGARRSGGRRQSVETEPDMASGSSPVVVCVASGPDYASTLRTYRDHEHPGVSTTVLIAWLVWRSLAAEGVDTGGSIGMLADMRRYLPKGSLFIGNFVGLVEAPMAADTTPEAVRDAVDADVRSYRPLLRLAGQVGLSRLRSAGRPRPRSGQAPTRDGRVMLTVSDHSKFPRGSAIAWTTQDAAELAVVISPAGEQHVAVTLLSAGQGDVQLTAKFYPSQIDPEVVRRALATALDAQNLMQQGKLGPDGSAHRRGVG